MQGKRIVFCVILLVPCLIYFAFRSGILSMPPSLTLN